MGRRLHQAIDARGGGRLDEGGERLRGLWRLGGRLLAEEGVHRHPQGGGERGEHGLARLLVPRLPVGERGPRHANLRCDLLLGPDASREAQSTTYARRHHRTIIYYGMTTCQAVTGNLSWALCGHA